MNKQQIQQKIQKLQQINPNAGYTIMEGLVAMIMVAFLMSAIAPVIALSVGTRVQARRVELASQAARSYIDGVRSGAIDPPDPLLQNPDSTVAPSAASPSCEDKDGQYCGTNSQLFCIDGGDREGCKISSPTDMIIQAGRFHPTQTDASLGYQLLVRVYRADAFQEASLCPGGTDCPDVGTQQSTVTNAIGNRRLPVVEIVPEIAPANSNGSFQNICDRIDSVMNVTPASSNCP
ncbi:hormogonium polysaccharide secretion pseudopilin HpsB [Dapis sp. BLCC M172]|uniref:hormogonium polysaccharide secretion pseudopilin HpsB n=1 Tax=Dapis sp. BLCC M172 TaxID=2975281 RepID=UPI003CED2168